MISSDIAIVVACLFGIVNKVTTWTVWTETDTMESATELGLVFGMTLQIAQLLDAVSKLTFVSVFTFTSFFKWSAQFGLVSVNT